MRSAIEACVSTSAINSARIVTEEFFLVAEGQVLDNAHEARIDRREVGHQTVHWKVAREQASVNPKQRDGVEHNRPVALHGPDDARLTQSGDLHHDVVSQRELLHCPAPVGQSRGGSIGGKTSVVEDNRGLGELTRQLVGFAEVPIGRLQIEGEPVMLQHRETPAPLRIAHGALRSAL